MTTGKLSGDFEEDRANAVRAVAQRTLVFGEFCAKHIGHEPFSDPVMHAYFLFFIFGAVDALGEDDSHDYALNDEEKTAAMREALLAFGTADARQVEATIRMLEQASDEPALKIRAEGREAAVLWRWGDNADATTRFHDLMQNPDNFPREVERTVSDESSPQ